MYKENGVLQGVATEKIKNGDIHLDDIPNIIGGGIDFLMSFVYTIGIVLIIFVCLRHLFNSHKTGEFKRGLVTIITGIVISSLSWFIIKFLIDNF